MTALTAAQLDEIERAARAAETPGPWYWGSEGDALETAIGRATVLGAAPCGTQNSYIYGSEGDKAHIAANSPDVTLRLVAIARAALAWVERQDRALAHLYEPEERALYDAIRGEP